jgi:hypothetical protein
MLLVFRRRERTVSPRERRCSARWLPMKPDAPVTSAFTKGFLIDFFSIFKYIETLRENQLRASRASTM